MPFGCSSSKLTLCLQHATYAKRHSNEAGDVISNKRNCLAPGKADMLVFLMDNL